MRGMVYQQFSLNGVQALISALAIMLSWRRLDTTGL